MAEPVMPGTLVRRQILEKMRIQQVALARALGISPARLSQFLNGHSSFNAEFALRLATVTRTDAEYWLGLQTRYDLYHVRQNMSPALEVLAPLIGALETDL